MFFSNIISCICKNTKGIKDMQEFSRNKKKNRLKRERKSKFTKEPSPPFLPYRLPFPNLFRSLFFTPPPLFLSPSLLPS